MQKFIIPFAFIAFVAFFGCKASKNLPQATLIEPSSYVFDTLQQYDIVEDRWWKLFGDTTLNSMVIIALENNKDLSQVFYSVEASRLAANNARAMLYPSLSATAGVTPQYTKPQSTTWGYNVKGVVSWEIDVFGKLSNQSKSYAATYVSAEWGERASQLSLIGAVTSNYFALLAYKKSSEVAQNSYNSRIESLALIDSMYRYGAVSLVDLEQARSLAYSAKASLYGYKKLYKQSEISLNTLLGRAYQPIESGDIFNLNYNIRICAGMPSMLLERRPDVMESYWNYLSTLYNIKGAIAARFPSVSLTAEGGIGSTFTQNISSGWMWQGAATLLQPIFNWGQNKRNVEIAQAKAKIAALDYEQSYISAVEDVNKALTSIVNGKKELGAVRETMRSTESYKELINQLYLSGMSNYLEVLDADRSLFTAQISYISMIQSLLDSYASLYKSLGGDY